MFIKTLGQTLIEVLVTVVIIAAAIIALVRFQNYLAYSNSLTQQTADATLVASNRMEYLRDFQVINTTPGFTAYAGIVTGNTTSTVGNTTYTVNWTVTTNTNPDYKTISVSVSWTDRRATTQTVTLVTRVGSIDPSQSATVM